MCEGDGGLVLDILGPEVRNEAEDLGRDTVDRGEPVAPGPDQAEDIESVLVESVNLRWDRVSDRP